MEPLRHQTKFKHDGHVAREAGGHIFPFPRIVHAVVVREQKSTSWVVSLGFVSVFCARNTPSDAAHFTSKMEYHLVELFHCIGWKRYSFILSE